MLKLKRLDTVIRELALLEPTTTVVYTYGAWDLIHPGHINLLSRAKDLGDVLVVGVVANKPIKELKGDSRPTQDVKDRMIMVNSVKFVDYVIEQPDYDPSDCLRKIGKISLLVKGDDWEYIPGEETIRDMGGKLVKLGYTSGFSTSSLIKKIGENK